MVGRSTVKLSFGIRHNIVANFAGKAWALIIGLAFVPLYIRLIGIESYGLVGIFASLTALLSVLDLGLSTTLNREMAKLSSEGDKHQEMRDSVRTFEVVYWAMGFLMGGTLVALSPLLSQYWLTADGLPTSTMTQSIMLMGIVVAFQWPSSLYSGGLLGLQYQVLLNVITIIFATVKAIGTLLVLVLIQSTIQTFFMWQILVTAATTATMAICIWRVLPEAGKPALFKKNLLLENWQFSAGMIAITILVTVLTQLDKVILSHRLTLEDFSYYSIASTLGIALTFLVGPIFTTLFPRLTQLATKDDQETLKRLYHQGCQLVSASVLPISAVVIFFSREIMSVWLRDPVLVQNTYLLLSLIAIGTTLNAMVTMPYALQLAHGWTRLTIYKNLLAVVILVPVLNLLISRWGAVGAAVAWISLNAGYVLFEVPIMHSRLLRGDLSQWYFADIGLPILISFSIAGASKYLFPSQTSLVLTAGWIALTSLIAFLGSILTMAETRSWAQVMWANVRIAVRARIQQGFRP